MSKIFRVFILLVAVAISSSVYAGGIEFFHGTWKEALEKAKAEDKILFVDSYAKWCGPCKRMAKTVFTQDKVGDFFNANFINLKLDMETADGITFGHKYPVSAYPTLFFLGVDGEVIKKVRGGQQAESLINHGKVALSSYDRSGEYEEKYLAGNRDFDLVYNYMKALADVGKPHLKVANEYLRSNPEITREQRNQFVFTAATEVDSKIFEEVIENKEAIIQEVGVEAFDKKVKKACLSAVGKAIEYDYPELLDEAIEVAKDNLHKDAKLFEYEARIDYALALNDVVNYVKYAKQWSKKSKYNGAVLDEIIDTVNKKFTKNAPAMQLGAEMVDKKLKYGDPASNKVALYTKVLTLGDKKKDALKLIEKLEKKNEGNESEIQQLKGLKTYIQNLEPLKD